MEENDLLTLDGVRRYLRTDALDIRVLETVSSTNTVLKELAGQGAAEGTCLIAGQQTAGRGRLGRSFYSPAGTGIYMSVLLRPTMSANRATEITAAAAVAAAQTIWDLTGETAEIKWVNDVVLRGKKVCGILTEGALDASSGALKWAVMGIGINASTPPGGFPEDIRSVAGAVFERCELPERRCRLAAGVLDRFWDRYLHLGDEDCWRQYRARSLVLGRRIQVLIPGREPRDAYALDVERDYSLRVRYMDGTVSMLRSGEVSIRPEN